MRGSMGDIIDRMIQVFERNPVRNFKVSIGISR
jgi:hypothetical protein